MENGRRVTKTIESDARGGTRAMMEEQEGNRTMARAWLVGTRFFQLGALSYRFFFREGLPPTKIDKTEKVGTLLRT